MNKVNKYKSYYFNLKKEINNKKYTKKFIENYILEMKVVKADSESIIKLCEVILLPLIIATVSGLLSFVGYKSIMFILFGIIFFAGIEIFISIWLIKTTNVRLVFINSIIKLCEQSLSKK